MTARPTLADVAARAGVSPSTASLAFSGSGPVSDATKERVLAAAAELGYAGPDPRARSLRRGRSGVVGVVLEERVRSAFLDPVKIRTLDGIADGLAPLGAGLLLLPDLGDADGSLPIDFAPVDAVVLLWCGLRSARAVEALQRRGIPTVAIECDAGDETPRITIDNREATARGARHLLELGHRRVAVVALPLDEDRRRERVTPERLAAATNDVTLERLAGAREVFPEAPAVSGDASSIEAGRLAALELLADASGAPLPASERPTAIIAQSDLLAAGAIAAAEELGLAVPGELSVLGFDGIRVDGLRHDLTTLEQPSTAKGRAAGEAVVKLLSGEPAESVAFTSTLHLGETTAAPAA
ncbi:substrate-binding domain-containing protein [Agromyces soli]